MIQPGHRTNVTQQPHGFSLNCAPPPGWRHPWKVTPRWVGRQWVAQIKPGTVNGRAPGYRTWSKQQKEFGNFGSSPLDGHEYFSSSVFNPRRKGDDPLRPIDIPLYMTPSIELRLRPIGLDGAPEDVVPEFFLSRGVGQRVTDTELAAALERGENPTAFPEGARRLQAADLILHQPRSGLSIEITIQPDFNGVSNVTQRLTVRQPDANDSLRVFSGHWDPAPQKIDPLSAIYEEPNYDEQLIATLYLLSPPGVGGTPNGSWLPFVKHNLFWPLTYSAPPPFRPRELSSGVLAAPFVGGLFQPIINFFTAAAGDAADMALNWMQAQSNRGRWWTATGGGSDAEFPEEPEQRVQVSGLGRAQRIAANQQQARRQVAADRRRNVLDPRFPFRALPYSRS